MDGKTIIPNSQVFDTIYGPGIVVDADQFVVKFDGHYQRYIEDGWNTTWKKRTLYWSEPLVIAPDPDIQKANKLKEALLKVKAILEG